MNKDLIMSHMRTVKDFPIKGILFWDLTTVFKNAECLNELIDAFYEQYKDKGVTKIVGIESRGFIIGAALAAKLNAGFVLARKPGKLPAETLKESYAKEYGTDTLEIHKDAITEDDVVLVHDDLLATGGTAAAVINLVGKFHPKKTYAGFIVGLKGLPGYDVVGAKAELTTLLDL